MIDVMKMALEALEYHQEKTRPIHKTQETITALRQAIEQAEKESTLQEMSDIGQEAHTDHPMRHWDRTCPACVAEAEKQEPVAWMSQGGDVSRSKKHFEEMGFNFVIPLYAAPFNWVGIAVDEIPSLWGNADADLWLFAQAIEAKLRERNI